MHERRFPARRAPLVLGVLALCAASFGWAQAGRSEAEIRAQYQAERAACLSGRSPADQETCLKEAGAAQAAALRGQLADDTARYRANALMRCNALPPADREACRMRIEGHGTTRGSVESGGIYRELVTREVGPAPAPSAAPLPGAPLPDAPLPGAPLPATPAPAATAPATSATPAPVAPAAPRAPGGPSFTPVQPVVPGAAAAPPPPAPTTVPVPALVPAPAMVPVPAAPAASPAPSASSPPTLQISPPTTPVQRVPEAVTLPPMVPAEPSTSR